MVLGEVSSVRILVFVKVGGESGLINRDLRFDRFEFSLFWAPASTLKSVLLFVIKIGSFCFARKTLLHFWENFLDSLTEFERFPCVSGVNVLSS